MNLSKYTLTIAILTLIAATPALAGGDKLVQEKGCMGCHDIASKKLGPSFKEVASKYKGQSDAAATLGNKVKAGGSGVWGAIPMPPQTTLTDEELSTMVTWVLSH